MLLASEKLRAYKLVLKWAGRQGAKEIYEQTLAGAQIVGREHPLGTGKDAETRNAQPAPAEWPKMGDDGQWRDSDGTVFREAQHGWNAEEKRPSVTDKGVFRARRGQAQPAPQAHQANERSLGVKAGQERAETQQRDKARREEDIGW